jgi:hypothetical protein
MNYESLILMMGNEVIFTHNRVIKFLSNTSFNTNSLFATWSFLKTNIANPLHMDQTKHLPTSHPFPLSVSYKALITIKH